MLENRPADEVRRHIRAWLVHKSETTHLEYAVLYDAHNARIWAGISGEHAEVDFPPEHHERLNRAGLALEVWHNHPDDGPARGSYGPGIDELAMLMARGTRSIGVVDDRGGWTLTTITDRKGLIWTGWRGWLESVDAAIANATVATEQAKGRLDWNPGEALARCAEAAGIVRVASNRDEVHVQAIETILDDPAVRNEGDPYIRSITGSNTGPHAGSARGARAGYAHDERGRRDADRAQGWW